MPHVAEPALRRLVVSKSPAPLGKTRGRSGRGKGKNRIIASVAPWVGAVATCMRLLLRPARVGRARRADRSSRSRSICATINLTNSASWSSPPRVHFVARTATRPAYFIVSLRPLQCGRRQASRPSRPRVDQLSGKSRLSQDRSRKRSITGGEFAQARPQPRQRRPQIICARPKKRETVPTSTCSNSGHEDGNNLRPGGHSCTVIHHNHHFSRSHSMHSPLRTIPLNWAQIPSKRHS